MRPNSVAETLLDLGTVKVARERRATDAEIERGRVAAEQSRICARQFRLNERRRQNGEAEAGVTEHNNGVIWAGLNLEAYGPTTQAVQAAMDRYSARDRRFHIQFYAIRPDADGGFVASGRASTERL